MARWLLRRAGQAVLVYLVAILAAFVLMRLAPGDPIRAVDENRQLSVAQVDQLRRQYGLDRPILVQFGVFASRAVRGDFGTSITQARPVRDLLAERLPATLLLGGTALLLNFVLGCWLGVRQALAAGRGEDTALGLVSVVSIALPSFWVGLLLVWAFGLHGPHLPVAGMHDPLRAPGAAAGVLDVLRHLVLPLATLVLVTIGSTMRYQRAAMLEALTQPFVRTARAKGLAPGAVAWRHAWRASLVPVVTLLGLWLPILVTGSVFVEAVFAWPGLGYLGAEAASLRDYPVVMGATMLTAALVIGGGLLADVAAFVVDPRLRPA